MNNIEQEEIAKIPEKYKPLSAWAYFGYSILFSIPILGFIFLVVFSFSGTNINRRSFARSYFCIYIVIGIVLLIAILAFGSSLTILFENIKELF